MERTTVFWIWILLVAAPDVLANCVLKENPVIRGRYADCFSFNALAGNDAIFNYTLPNVVLPLLTMTVDEKGGDFLGSCSPGDPADSCNRTTRKVAFRSEGDNVLVILPNVTSAQSMDYVIRATRNDGKTFDPDNLELTVTMKVFEESHLRIPFDVTNVFDSPEVFSPLEPPYSSNNSYEFELHHQYSLYVNLHELAPPANVTIVQRAGLQRKTYTCTMATAPCVKTIEFNDSKEEDQVWKIEMSVQFNVQNVGEAHAEFFIAEMETPVKSNPKAVTLGVAVSVPLLAILALGLFLFCFLREKDKDQQRSKYMSSPNGIDFTEYLVKSEELKAAEYTYRIPKIGSEYQKQLVVTLKLAAAMMNTCGGIVECNMTNAEKQRKKWMKDVKKYFNKYLTVNFDVACGYEEKKEGVMIFVRQYHEPVYVTTHSTDDAEGGKILSKTRYIVEEDGSIIIHVHDNVQTSVENIDEQNVPNGDATATESDHLLMDNESVKYTKNKRMANDEKMESILPDRNASDEQVNGQRMNSAEVPVEEDERRNEWYRKPEMTQTTEQALQNKVLAWTCNSFIWRSHVPEETRQKSFMLTLTSPVNFVPSKNSIASFGTAAERQNIVKELDKIEKKHEGKKSCVVYMQSSDNGTELMCIVEESDPEFIVILPVNPIDVQSMGKYYEKCRTWKRRLSMELQGKMRHNSRNASKTKTFILKTNTSLTGQMETEQKGHSSTISDLLMKHMSVAQNPAIFPLLQEALYSMMMSKYAAIQFRLGNAKLAMLAKPKVTGILQQLAVMHYIEGPPGSGKSLIALGLFEEESKKFPGRVLYCCPTETLRAFFHSNGVAEENSKLLKSPEHLRELPVALDDYDVIIIDDTQRVEVSDMSLWEALFQEVVLRKKKLYIFVDSKFQDYQNFIKDDALKEAVEKICSEQKVKCYQKTLTEVFRNSKKVFSFMKGNLKETVAAELICNHDEYGDDVLVCHLKNTEEMSERNDLLKLVRGLLGMRNIGMSYEHSVHYKPNEIAIIVGGTKSESDFKILTGLFKECAGSEMNIQTLMKQPVKGLVIDTVDNICGLDSPVCIYYPGRDANKSALKDNDKYKTYIASRGINLVIFVETAEVLTIEDAEKMNMGKLENIVHDDCSDWRKRDIYATLQSVQNAHREEDILKGLSSITAKIGEEDVAISFVEHDGIPIVHRRINKSGNSEIRERGLICLTAVALHDRTYIHLMRNDVIEVACRELKREWAPEWWEAAYLLGHLLYKGKEQWSDIIPSRDEVIQSLQDSLRKRDQQKIWKKDRTSAVAHGEIDYNTYKLWLEHEKAGQELHYLAMLSLCNLILSNGKIECYNLHRFIGVETIERIIDSELYKDRVRQLASVTQKAFHDTKYVPGAWDRDYSETI